MVVLFVSNAALEAALPRPTSSIRVHRLDLSKEALQKFPTRDRNFLFLASQACNQINVFQKFITFSTNFDGRDEIEEYLSAGQSQVVLRHLTGSLSETWEMIKRSENQKLIGQTYKGCISEDGMESYDRLKKIFGSNNLLHRVRNELAFHFLEEKNIDAAFAGMPAEEDLSWYAADNYANTFYLGSDKILSMREMQLTGKNDPREAFTEVMELIVCTARDVVNFLTFTMRAILERNLGAHYLDVYDREGKLYENIPHMWDVSLPFFVYR